ncbi:MAG: type II toxin-antitoxin system VapC family toxin [Longimicrobiales bacterium]
MKLLLDTHVVLWWLEDSARLGKQARKAIARADVVFVSVASGWEAAIKISLGRLTIPGSLEDAVESSRFSKLPITFGHAAALGDLPFHHRDPFDRMLIVQARAEGLTIVTADRKFEPYDVAVIWS